MSIYLTGPFHQLLTLNHLPLKGALIDEPLEIIEHAGIIHGNGIIEAVGNFEMLKKEWSGKNISIENINGKQVALPGFIDAHTHTCFGGSRAADYALRVSGKSYLEIAQAGGGIWDSVQKTRQCSQEELAKNLSLRMDRHLREGVTTCEVKSGYGLNVADELKMLRAIAQVNSEHPIDLVATCLAAHTPPKDFDGRNKTYLDFILKELLPLVKKENLSNRIDIFIEQSAFALDESLTYLRAAQSLGFDITIHADQFTTGGSEVAIAAQAISADHLEASGEKEIAALAQSNVIAVALPGASLGLGCNYTPVRKLLDAGACVAIASDWNPGSAPMGDLLMQAAVLGAAEKLTTAETFAGITYRAAAALGLHDRGMLKQGMKADFITFDTDDYREILYHQGKMKPMKVWKGGKIFAK